MASATFSRRSLYLAFSFALILTALLFVGVRPASAQVVPGITSADASADTASSPTPNVDPTTDKVNVGSVDETPATSSSDTSSGPTGPTGPTGPKGPNTASISVNFGNGSKPSQSILIIIVVTLLSVAPALLVMLTSFTRIIIVLSLTRNALGVQTVPPSQVLIGLALFLSLFIMGPTFSKINTEAVQPFLNGKITQSVAVQKGTGPLRDFMLAQTHKDELNMFLTATKSPQPKSPSSISLSVLIPAFIISELKTAFIIGFVIFIPFLVIDLIVSASLMSMGMMMLPPIMVSLPFKLLLFVLVDGWGLVVKSLITSFKV